MFKAYYQLTKPGIIYGNAITALAGFFFAAKNHIHPLLLLAMIIGLSCVIASACVINNIADVEIDSKMPRTQGRELVQKTIPKRHAIIYAIILGLVGFGLLYFKTNLITTFVAFVGWLVYVAMYTPMKPRSVHATLVGSISGATPPVVGYCAVTNKFDIAALLLFVILVVWQMPHFYAIAIRRSEDYAAAHVPVLPIVKGVQPAKIQILIYIILFIIATTLLTVFKFTKYTYLVVALALGLTWLYKAIQGFKVTDDKLWAKNMFLFSLIVLTSLSALLAFNSLLP